MPKRNTEYPSVVYSSELIVPRAYEESGYFDISFGAPEEVVVAIATQIKAEVERRNRNPYSMLYSGYSTGPTDDLSDRHADKLRGEYGGDSPIRSFLDEDADDYEMSPIGPGQARYFFNDYDSLFSGSGLDSPIAYAALSGQPTIGVYPVEKLMAIGLDSYSTVTATPLDITDALLFEFRIRYASEIGSSW